MRNLIRSLVAGCFLLLMVLVGSSGYASDEMRILTGQDWIQLTPGHKVMFISGVGHVVEFERHLMGKDPSLESKSFIPHLISGMKGRSIKEIVEEIDLYYEANPTARNRPVLHVIFHAVIFPKMDTK